MTVVSLSECARGPKSSITGGWTFQTGGPDTSHHTADAGDCPLACLYVNPPVARSCCRDARWQCCARAGRFRTGIYDGWDPWTRVAKSQIEVAEATHHPPPHLPLMLTSHDCLGECDDIRMRHHAESTGAAKLVHSFLATIHFHRWVGWVLFSPSCSFYGHLHF